MHRRRPFAQRELNTRFNTAARMNNHGLVTSLASQGASIDAIGKHDRTALSWAAFNENKKTILFLLSRAANPHHQDQDGNTPLHLILKEGSRDKPSDWEEAVLALVKATSIADLQDDLNNTPLALAASREAPAIVNALAAAGADVNQKSAGIPLLYSAALFDRHSMVETLLARGADPNAGCEDTGHRPLSIAAHKGHWGIVSLLAKKGADTMISDWKNRHPENYARKAGRQDIVDLLQKARDAAYVHPTKKPVPALPRLRVGK